MPSLRTEHAALAARIIRFGLGGLANSAVGIATVMAGLAMGLGDFAANTLGYAVGLVCSYAINRYWTFAVQRAPSWREFARFLACFGVAWGGNLLVIAAFHAAGVAGRPIVHITGMAVYSVLFFVLSRHVAFAEGDAVPGLQIEARAPEWALAALALATWAAMRALPLHHDVHWQFWVARQVLHGAELYRDIYEVNPPLWFWSAMPIVALGDALRVDPLRLLVPLVLAGAAFAAWLVGQAGEWSSPRRRMVAMAATFWMLAILPTPDFGQRDPLSLIGAVAWAALIALRARGRAVALPVVLAAALTGSFGFALKHYYALIPVMLELWLWRQDRARWRAIRLETVVLGLFAAGYALALPVFAGAYLTRLLPMIRLAYGVFTGPSRDLLHGPWVGGWICVACWLVLDARIWKNRWHPVVAAQLIVALGYLAAYLLQAKGWHYQAVPATSALALVLALRVADSAWRRSPALLSGLIVLIAIAGNPVEIGPYINTIRPGVEPLVADVAPGEAMLVLGPDPMWAWPLFEERGFRWPSRYYAYWPIPAIAAAEAKGQVPAALAQLAAETRAEATLEMRCSAPAMLLIERHSRYPAQPASFDERGFFLRDPAMRAYLSAHYRQAAPSADLWVYRRIGTVAPDRSADCPGLPRR